MLRSTATLAVLVEALLPGQGRAAAPLAVALTHLLAARITAAHGLTGTAKRPPRRTSHTLPTGSSRRRCACASRSSHSRRCPLRRGCKSPSPPHVPHAPHWQLASQVRVCLPQSRRTPGSRSGRACTHHRARRLPGRRPEHRRHLHRRSPLHRPCRPSRRRPSRRRLSRCRPFLLRPFLRRRRRPRRTRWPRSPRPRRRRRTECLRGRRRGCRTTPGAAPSRLRGPRR